jgi:ParB-like chromosome segregation protein Spo0J
MLPTFVVIGAMKAGTTTFASHLDRHPEIFVSRPKEPQFFSQRWDRGLEWYETLFEKAGDAIARGEASTTYTKLPMHPEAAERMAATIPDARLIYLVRDPVDRMRSHWLHRVHDGEETRPIEQALREEPRYTNRSRYAMQLEHYLERFPRQHMYVVQAEEMYVDPAAVLPNVFRFLGVDPNAPILTQARENSSATRFDMPASVRHKVRVGSRSPLYRAVPRPVRKLLARPVRKALSAPVPPAEISPDLRAELLAVLADDQARFREILQALPVS